jgi:hypothetical protein
MRRYQTYRLCLSKVLRSMPAVSVDSPSLYRYGAAFGQFRWGCNGLRVRKGQQNFMCESPARRVTTTQGWVIAGTERANSCMASEALPFFGSTSATCSSVCVRAPMWRVTGIIRLCANIMLRRR